MITSMLKGKLDYYIVYVVNEVGDVWQYSVMKKERKIYVRQMDKANIIFSRNELDMIFTGNKKIFEGAI